MKLESLKLGKFKNNVLKKEQLFVLNGGGIKSDGGNITDRHAGRPANFNYGYDAYRNGILTFHNRSNVIFVRTYTDGNPDDVFLTASDPKP